MLSALKCTIRALTFLLVFASCKPVIHSFRVTPNPVLSNEKVRVDWDVRGTPSLEFSEHTSVDSVQLLDFTLLVKRGTNEIRQTIQVQKLNPVDTLVIGFATSKLEGDTVVATGENNTSLWNKFQVLSVRSISSREILSVHAGRKALLRADGAASTAFAGTVAGGEWTLKAVLTAAEKADHTKIPEQLKIKVVIKPLNQ